MEWVIVIGGNASGKTTMAHELAKRLDLPLVHIDRLYWSDDWKPTPNAEFDERLRAEVAKPRWLIEGNNRRTIPMRLARCDTAIYMDFSGLRCVLGALKRKLQWRNKSRPEMGGFCVERFDRQGIRFLAEVWRFNRRNRQSYYEMLDAATGVRVIVLRNRREVRLFLAEL